MDKYNSIIARLFAMNKTKRWAVTLGQTAYFSVAESEVSESWHVHEDTHKRQWKRDGYIKFIIRYLWQWIFKGYKSIDYEIEARKATSDFLGRTSSV